MAYRELSIYYHFPLPFQPISDMYVFLCRNRQMYRMNRMGLRRLLYLIFKYVIPTTPKNCPALNY